MGSTPVSAYTGVSPRSEIIDDGDYLSRAESLEGYKICYPNDLVMNIMLAWNRGLAFSKYEGIVSPAYCVFILKDGSSPKFLNYLVRSDKCTLYFKAFSSGVIDSRLRIYPDTFGRLFCNVPPLTEQNQIAAFLDRETAKIDDLVAQQRRLMELLKEKRQAVISHAVTQGLNPQAPKKPSGIEWLGDVPAHWEVCSVRRVVRAIEQGWSPECFARPAENDEWGVLKAGCVNRGVYDENDNKALPAELQPIPEYEVRVGDVLMSRASGSPELVGSTALVTSTRDKLMLSDKIFRLRFEDRVESRFFVAALNSLPLRSQIEQALSGGNGLANNLPQSSLRGFFLALPTSAEQLEICRYLEAETAKFDTLTTEAQRAIDLLQERRAALISAAVTGQIDVRSAV
jgi:type I restriction enzyme, S subunit